MRGNIIERRIGSVIGCLRAEHGETQQELANIIGVKRETINQWESGTRYIKAGSIIKLAKHFDVSADYILGLTENKSSNLEIKDMCKYTGLSEKAIKMIHDLNTFIDFCYIEAQENSTDDADDEAGYNLADGSADLYDELNSFLENEVSWEIFANLAAIYKAVQYSNMLLGIVSKIKLNEIDTTIHKDYEVMLKEHKERLEKARHHLKFSVFELSESSKKAAQSLHGAESVYQELTAKIDELNEIVPLNHEETERMAGAIERMMLDYDE